MPSRLSFDKVHACGNDFVLVDTLVAPQKAIRLCDRHHGLGGDGVMVFCRGQRDTVRLDHFDADGSRSFCLNGIRASLACLAAKEQIASAGQVESEGVTLEYELNTMPRLFLNAAAVHAFQWLGQGQCYDGFRVDVGNPHFVVSGLDADPFREIAPVIRADLQAFPQGTNVNLVQERGSRWHILTYERGVEAFTLACGSGILAAARVLNTQNGLTDVIFEPEGNGWVQVTHLAGRVMLTGPVQWVARGEWLCSS